jgi:hypothetical protein
MRGIDNDALGVVIWSGKHEGGIVLKFRCKKCKNTFSFEEHPLFQELKGKLNTESKQLSDEEMLKAFSEAVMKITEQIP